CRDAWSAWYREHGAKADLTPAVLPAPAGGALVVLLNPRNQEGSVAQLRPDETSIWQIEGLEYPLYAEEIAGKRVLIAEYEGERITERNFHGEIQWSKELGRPVLSAHRLPSGNTFVVHRNRVVELDRDGKEVFAHSRAVRDIAAARRLPDGQVVLLTDTGDCVFLDANGQEVHRFSTGARQVLGAGFDVLPNRRVLVPHFTENKVIEYGPTGEVLWQAQVRSPTSVHRLPGGITLVASTETREVLEIDRTGKELWKHTVPAPARPVCALGR
ncbi:MAG TPA: PQQ-binding-like beta-propeller repeat protein, partial [Gemmataceae bacterium]|nr:PQQ-binding-like beta-propeller repeat protein [Gemmataceae bacterium]